MVSFLAALALSQNLGDAVGRDTYLSDPSGQPRLLMKELFRRLNPAKQSPKKFGSEAQPWIFEWITSGYAQTDMENKQLELRFRVYNQERKEKNDLGPQITEALLRLWQMNVDNLRIEHSDSFNRRIVDVYVCWGGKAGGEQLFDLDRQVNPPVKVNTIYLYDIRSFQDPIEMVREVAHEYGHATLPAIGGYGTPPGMEVAKVPLKTPVASGVKGAKVAAEPRTLPLPKPAPEYWANGILGERLYLMWLRDGMLAGAFNSADAMGATVDQITKWLQTNVEPGVLAASQNAPDRTRLGRTDAVGMESYHSLALYAATVLPNAVFARSIKLTGSTSAVDYPQGIVLAAQEPPKVELTIPPYLAGRAIWVPSGKGILTGAKELLRKGDWVKIMPTEAKVGWINASA